MAKCNQFRLRLSHSHHRHSLVQCCPLHPIAGRSRLGRQATAGVGGPHARSCTRRRRLLVAMPCGASSGSAPIHAGQQGYRMHSTVMPRASLVNLAAGCDGNAGPSFPCSKSARGISGPEVDGLLNLRQAPCYPLVDRREPPRSAAELSNQYGTDRSADQRGCVLSPPLAPRLDRPN